MEEYKELLKKYLSLKKKTEGLSKGQLQNIPPEYGALLDIQEELKNYVFSGVENAQIIYSLLEERKIEFEKNINIEHSLMVKDLKKIIQGKNGPIIDDLEGLIIKHKNISQENKKNSNSPKQLFL